ncbi:amidase family protein [Streptomyces sp. NPDC020794]|uniref:amidase family protein n=1 Tax=unclassified Streptomyces TaxID=2593676 RepID=UPI0036ECF237
MPRCAGEPFALRARPNCPFCGPCEGCSPAGAKSWRGVRRDSSVRRAWRCVRSLPRGLVSDVQQRLCVVDALHGVPSTVKDSFETAGMRTVCGRTDLENYIPDQDAEAVRGLRSAGAVIMGRSNMPAGNQDVQADNPVFGPSSDPWDRARTSGGSAGGAVVPLHRPVRARVDKAIDPPHRTCSLRPGAGTVDRGRHGLRRRTGPRPT